MTVDYTMHAFEWAGSILAIAGSMLMARKSQDHRRAWQVWIGSNFFLLVFAVMATAYGLLAMQLSFMVVNVYGLLQELAKKTVKHERMAELARGRRPSTPTDP